MKYILVALLVMAAGVFAGVDSKRGTESTDLSRPYPFCQIVCYPYETCPKCGDEYGVAVGVAPRCYQSSSMWIDAVGYICRIQYLCRGRDGTKHVWRVEVEEVGR